MFEKLNRNLRRVERLAAKVGVASGAQVEEFILHLLQSPRYADGRRLNHFEHQVFSQNGEDGVVAEILRRIGVRDKTFLEIGVGDGFENNTCFWLFQGWRGTWIDGHEPASLHGQLKTVVDNGKLIFHRAWIKAETIAQLLKDLSVPTEVDLFSLDIDRNTYWVWAALHEFRPRVVVVEYNSAIPASIDWKVEYHPTRVWNDSMYFGASLKALENLGRELGYSLVGCETTGLNAFFVRSDLCNNGFAGPFTSEEHFEPPRYWLTRRPGHPLCFNDDDARTRE